MSFQECIDFIHENPTCALATTNDGQPRVRGLVALWARSDGIYFTTARTKDLYAQMQTNPRIELCFLVTKPIKHLRVAGEAEFVDDPELRKAALDERPYLRQLGLQDARDPNFILFRVAHGEAHFWTWENNCREAEIPRISF